MNGQDWINRAAGAVTGFAAAAAITGTLLVPPTKWLKWIFHADDAAVLADRALNPNAEILKKDEQINNLLTNITAIQQQLDERNSRIDDMTKKLAATQSQNASMRENLQAWSNAVKERDALIATQSATSVRARPLSDALAYEISGRTFRTGDVQHIDNGKIIIRFDGISPPATCIISVWTTERRTYSQYTLTKSTPHSINIFGNDFDFVVDGVDSSKHLCSMMVYPRP